MNNKLELTREAFMKKTGLFVSPLYFDMIQLEYKEYQGESPEAFCTDWINNNKYSIVETELSGKLKYVIDDDSLTALGNSNVPDVEDLTALDIIENLCSDIKNLHDLCSEKDKDIKSLLDASQNLLLSFKESRTNIKP